MEQIRTLDAGSPLPRGARLSRENWSVLHKLEEGGKLMQKARNQFNMAAGPNERLIGEPVSGEGVFIGLCLSKSRYIFAAFAAPELLGGGAKGVRLSYVEAAKKIENLCGWHGQDGAGRVPLDEITLYAGLEDGSLCGKWVLPPIGVLTGHNMFVGGFIHTLGPSSRSDQKASVLGRIWSCTPMTWEGSWVLPTSVMTLVDDFGHVGRVDEQPTRENVRHYAQPFRFVPLLR